MNANLTPAEINIFKASLSGGTSAMIAAKLSITTRTVDTHFSNIYAKSGCPSPNRYALLRWGISQNLVTVEEFLNA